MPGQVYSVGTRGGNTTLPYLTAMLRELSQPKFVFREFVNAQEAIGRGRGDTFEFSKVGDVETQGGVLTETNTIPRTAFQFWKGTATIDEFGNAVTFTRKLSELSQFDIENTVQKRLGNDMVRTLESAAGDQYVATDWIAVCTATNGVVFTTNGTATATATSDLTAHNVRDISDYLRQRNIPTYDGSSYLAICSVPALRGMHDDSGTGGWIDISKYTGEFASRIHMRETGKFYDVRFVEETGYLATAIGNSDAHGQAVIVGDDYVYEATSIAEEIRTDEDDFGRSHAMAWYALLGFKIVWDYATDSEQRGIFVTSA